MSNALSPFGMAFAGAVGGVVSNSVVYPLDTIKTRIQTEVSSSSSTSATTGAAAVPLPSALKRPGAPRQLPARKGTSARQMFFRILKQQGVAGLYRGFGASMLNTFSMQFAYFYWYTIVRRTYIRRFPSVVALNTVTELALGALAAAFAQLFTIPVSVIATRQQLSDKSTTFVATLRAILADDGITGLWRGLKPSLVLVSNPSLTYGAFERLKSALLKPGEKMTPGKAFLLGALSKTIATVVTYPYIMAKTRLQAKCIDNDAADEESAIDTPLPSGSTATAAANGPKPKTKERYNGAIDLLTQVYKENGFIGWYQGMQAQITKAVLSQALLFGIKDMLEAYVVLSLIWWSRASGAAVGIKKA